MLEITPDIYPYHRPGTKVTANLMEKLLGYVGFFFSIVLSKTLLGNPFFGGALFIAGQLILLYAAVFSKESKKLLPRQERFKYICFIPITLVFILCLFVVYPLVAWDRHIPLLLLFIGTQHLGLFLFTATPLTPKAVSARRQTCILLYFAVVLVSCFLLAAFFRADTYLILLAYYAISTVLVVVHEVLKRRAAVCEVSPLDTEDSAETLGSMMEVYSYKLYRNMNANIGVAFEISLLMLVYYLIYLPYNGLWESLLGGAALMGLYSIAGLTSRLLLRKGRLREMGKNMIFIIFSAIWMTTNLYLNKNSDTLSPLHIGIAFSLLCLCITALASVVISMDSDMQVIGELGIKHFHVAQYELFKRVMGHWSLFISRLALLLLIGLMAFFMKPAVTRGIVEMYIPGRYGVTLLPAVFLLFGVLAAIKQPLTKPYEQKLEKYSLLKKKGESNKSLEERLRLVLVEKYSKRLGMRLLMLLLKPFFHHKILGRKNVDSKNLPVVFVCNHSEVYGPITATLNIPYSIRPWIIHEMVDLNKITQHMKSTFDRQKWIPRPIRDRMGRTIGPIIAWAMNAMDPIPVYRNDGRDILKSISLTVDALEADDNILLFPENPMKTGRYVLEGVGEFYSGFVNIAKAYYKRTGHALTFHSVFADKKGRTLSFSPGITFNPQAPYAQEKKRIADCLYQAMVQMSESHDVRRSAGSQGSSHSA